MTASRDGDLAKLRAILAADVAVYADGGGKAATVTNEVVGIRRLCACMPGSRGCSIAAVRACCHEFYDASLRSRANSRKFQ
ncbi:hypothetical protein EHI46_23815 [Rhizobium leguminosarum]|uniref:hypothetical protein n=1 Tax=Rhizobium leguminosarum TaxID=384 RepID=UPI000FED5838|nr:hypothetical protein [Rhizobium leguminosarum]RWY68462.1 hypothetical protein EHI46_23815 [Rhizobium leguminosarum]